MMIVGGERDMMCDRDLLSVPNKVRLLIYVAQMGFGGTLGQSVSNTDISLNDNYLSKLAYVMEMSYIVS